MAPVTLLGQGAAALEDGQALAGAALVAVEAVGDSRALTVVATRARLPDGYHPAAIGQGRADAVVRGAAFLAAGAAAELGVAATPGVIAGVVWRATIGGAVAAVVAIVHVEALDTA